MLRWLWKMQSDRGGQHAEAGVLMAILLLLGTAVTVGSVPQLSSAVADQWVCHISDRGNQRCEGESTKGEIKAGKGFTAKGFTAKTFGSETTATTAGYTDPGWSHFPSVETDEPPRYTATSSDVGGEVGMQNCWVGSQACTGQDGTYYQCKTMGNVDPRTRQLFTTWQDCTMSLPSMKGFTCTDEGLSATFDTCYNRDGIFHCYQFNGPDDMHCKDSNNDADASIPDGQPVSCGKLTNNSATCMGSNGTLYQCLDIKTKDNCIEGGRNLSPTDPALTDCVPILSHGDTTGQVVRCTYTPTTCNPEPADGSCGDQAVSVRCLKDPPSDPNIEYEHCQSLRQIVPAGQSLQTWCVTATEGASTCDAAVSIAVTKAGLPAGEVPVALGQVNVTIDPAETFDISVDGETRALTIDELTDHCEANVTACDNTIDEQVDESLGALTDALRGWGVCGDDCAAFVDRLPGAGGQGPTRGLLYDGTDLAIGLVAGGLSLAGGIYNLVVGNYATGTLFTAGTVATILREIRNYRLRHISTPRQQAATLALVQRATAGLVAGLAEVTNSVGQVIDATQTQAELQDLMIRYIEEGRRPGGF